MAPRLVRSATLLLALFALLPACRDRDAASSPPGEAAPALAPPGRPAGPVAGASARALKITTETTIATTDVRGAAAALRAAAGDFGGFVSDARVSGGDDVRSADLELRVPSDRLADFRAGFAQIGTIVSDGEKAEDVTEQRADLKARVRNAKAQEKRLLDLLSDKTGSLADVIAAEKALAEARDTIERLEAQETTLEGQIALATVRVHLVRSSELEASKSAGDRVLDAASRGIGLAGDAAIGALIALATVGPTLALFALVGLLSFLGLRKVGRRLGWWRPRVAPVYHAHYAPPPHAPAPSEGREAT